VKRLVLETISAGLYQLNANDNVVVSGLLHGQQ
jgi:hypothetical protein